MKEESVGLPSRIAVGVFAGVAVGLCVYNSTGDGSLARASMYIVGIIVSVCVQKPL